MSYRNNNVLTCPALIITFNDGSALFKSIEQAHAHSDWALKLVKQNRVQSLLVLNITPVVFPLCHVKMPAVNKSYCISSVL